MTCALPLFINGKFTCQRTTGVQRVASNLLLAFDRLLARQALPLAQRVTLLVPSGAPRPDLSRVGVQEVGPPGLPLHLWEQVWLPLAARSGLLLNLAGAAPLMARRQFCMLHDAAVFDRPEAYTVAFRAWYAALFWLLPRLGAGLLTVSPFSKRRLAQRLHIDAGRIGLVPNGGDHLLAVAPQPGVLGRFRLAVGGYFLAVGSASPNKNFARLLQAFAGLSCERPLKLVIVGEPDDRVFARGAAAGGGEPVDAERVVYTGGIDDASLKALYVDAIGLVVPSLYEGFGLPALEAMSCRCPVLAAQASALPEVCGDAAVYFDPASTDQLRAAMARLLAEPALRQSLIAAGSRRLALFGWDDAARALQQRLSHRPAGAAP